MTKGLGDRAQLVRVFRRSCSSEWLLQKGLSKLGKGDLWAGISLVNLDTALRMADVGPSADNKEEVIVLFTLYLNYLYFKNGLFLLFGRNVHSIALIFIHVDATLD